MPRTPPVPPLGQPFILKCGARKFDDFAGMMETLHLDITSGSMYNSDSRRIPRMAQNLTGICFPPAQNLEGM